MSIKQINWLDPGGKIVAVGTPAAVSRDITWQDLESMNFGVDFRFSIVVLGLLSIGIGATQKI